MERNESLVEEENDGAVTIVHQGMPLAIPARKMRDRSEIRYEIGNPTARRQHGIARRAQREAEQQALEYFQDISSYFPMGGIGAAVAAKRKGELAYETTRRKLS